MLIKLRPMTQKAQEALIHEKNLAKELSDKQRKSQLRTIAKAHKSIKVNSVNAPYKGTAGVTYPKDSKGKEIKVGDIIHIAVQQYRTAYIREGVVTSLMPGHDEYTGLVGYIYFDNIYDANQYKLTKTSKPFNIIIVGKYKVPS